MDIELRHLRVICAIAESGSVTKAAASLGLAQPALTAQLQRIERALGGPLFDRLLKTQRARTDGDAIAVFELLLEAWLAVNENFICAASELAVDYRAIDDRESSVFCLIDVGVITGGARIIQHHCVVRCATDCASNIGHEAKLPLSPAGIGDF